MVRPGSPVRGSYEFIGGLKYAYPIVRICQWLEVSPSGYYEWRGRPTSATAERRERLTEQTTKIFNDEDATKAHLLEAKDNLLRMLATVGITDEEREAIDDGHAALDSLLERLVDVPTPAGPTPRQIATPPTATLLPIVDIRPAETGRSG